MEFLRRWFAFSKGERVAIVTILALMLVLILACLFRPSRKSLSDASLHDLDSLLALRQAAIELQQQQTEKPQAVTELHPFPFNPNTITEEEWLQMGLTDRQVRSIMNYKAKGGRFYSKSDVEKLYAISEEEYAQLEPFIVLPEVARGNTSKPTAKKQESQASDDKPKPEKKAIPIVDLNTVDSTTLVELPRMGGYMASRIIAFRDKMGGFVEVAQLLDVKGLDSTRFAAMRPYLLIGDTETRKIDVNRADFKTLVGHPYLSYEQVKRIFRQRETRGMIKNWEQLEALLKEEGEVHPLLEYYLCY